MKLDIVRAWKDESYRASLSEEQLALLPANPIGEIELSDSDLASVCGGTAKGSHRHHHHHHHRWDYEDYGYGYGDDYGDEWRRGRDDRDGFLNIELFSE